MRKTFLMVSGPIIGSESVGSFCGSSRSLPGTVSRAWGGSSFLSKIYYTSAFLLLSCFPGRVNGQNQEVTVVIRNIKTDKGTVRVALYNSGREFMKTAWRLKSAPSKQGEMEFIFEDVPPGDYAMSVMHDSNDNGKLDTNRVGIPKEGFGFSHNAAAPFGPPPFEKARFTMPGENTLTITMMYY
jgi:uncharacterized protein (DUF2141 family)